MSGKMQESVLEARIASRAEMAGRARKKRKKREVSYDMRGRRIRSGSMKWAKRLGFAGIFLAAIAAIIYVPPLFYRQDIKITSSPIIADASALRTATQYYKEHPGEDFDNDGMINSLEEQYGTDPFRADTDFDGISDFAEVNITKTSPSVTGKELAGEVAAQDDKNGYTIGTPYKIDDIIFWPDTYADKATGGVVRTVNGFRFCFYNGWIKFPEPVYAYRYENGIHRPLKHREEEDAWYVDGNYEVRCYSQELRFTNRLRLPFMSDVYLDDSDGARMLSDLLPDQGGLITCIRMAEIDTEPDTEEDVVNPVSAPFIDTDDPSRFSTNTNTLKDYNWVIKNIDAGYCVGVSLYSQHTGESLAVIYGYTQEGDLLAADAKTLKAAGIIQVKEYAMRMMGEDGDIGQYTWFEWSGLGFDSLSYGDRINFISSTATDKTNNDTIPAVRETETENRAEHEDMTESERKETEEPESATGETEDRQMEETTVEQQTSAPGQTQTEENIQTETQAQEQKVATFSLD